MAGNDLKNLTDDVLVSIYRSKQTPEALGILYNRYAHLVYGVCLKYLKNTDNAKDHTMQIFEKLITDLPKHDVQQFKAWIYRVAQNQCFMTLRSEKHLIKSVDEFKDDDIMENEQVLHPKEEQEIAFEKLEEAMKDINEEQRICIELFYLQKKTYLEIMKQTGFNFMQVKSFIQNGKRNLKIKMTAS